MDLFSSFLLSTHVSVSSDESSANDVSERLVRGWVEYLCDKLIALNTAKQQYVSKWKCAMKESFGFSQAPVIYISQFLRTCSNSIEYTFIECCHRIGALLANPAPPVAKPDMERLSEKLSTN